MRVGVPDWPSGNSRVRAEFQDRVMPFMSGLELQWVICLGGWAGQFVSSVADCQNSSSWIPLYKLMCPHSGFQACKGIL
jgi:hypothetical protein